MVVEKFNAIISKSNFALMITTLVIHLQLHHHHITRHSICIT